jgi:amino acid adenylation domain-containing protein
MHALDPACLHQLFERQARRTPQAAAVAFEGERMSYAELDRRTGELAERLRERGAGPDVRVALFLERSLRLVEGILGILKAGAAYVPIDPAYPAARIAFIMEDAGARIVLTERALLAALPAGAPRTLCIDDGQWRARPARAPAAAPGARNLAYVIYTSGSTGKPKGVCIEHRNIVNYVLGVTERMRFEAGMQHAMVSTIAADLGNTVLFPSLATGGCLHVISRERAEDQRLLAEYFSSEAIDVLKIAPSHLAALQAGRDPQRVMPRRRLVLGGEACALGRVEQLRALAPECEIHNHYGPTETTVGVLTFRVGRELPSTPTRTLPLGTPLPNIDVRVLDPHGRPCAAGEKGELHIGGAGVARGYLNRAELTAEKFIPDPFHSEPGARLYRTGDLARALPDGSIEFCGRQDNQVKLGGHRVELGEIEQALCEHGEVREAVVLARDDGAGGKQLVAYVARDTDRLALAGDDTALEPASLRRHLGERLPRHMVPQAFVVLDRFPLLANGKIDRLALPPAEALQASTGHIAPRTELEKSLAALWSQLLRVETVGAGDDFFDLGGKSLTAMQLVARVRDAYGVDVHLRNLFERPTLAGFAELVGALAWARDAAARPARGDGREEMTL